MNILNMLKKIAKKTPKTKVIPVGPEFAGKYLQGTDPVTPEPEPAQVRMVSYRSGRGWYIPAGAPDAPISGDKFIDLRESGACETYKYDNGRWTAA